MWNYNKRVTQDLRRWQDQGILGKGAADAIAEDLSQRQSRFGVVGVLAVLGAVLIGFAAMSFVAANWQEMSRLTRMAVLFSGLCGSYVTAGWLAARNMDLFANAATLAGVGFFGASIMLIAQMFHIEGNPPDAVLMWGAGTLLAGVALQSTAALGLTMPLMMLWGGWEQVQTQDTLWWFLPVWGVVTAAYIWFRWRPGLHLSGIALSVFVISLGWTMWSGGAHSVVVNVGLAVIAAAYAVREIYGDQYDQEAIAAAGYGLATAFCGLLVLQFFDNNDLAKLIGLAVLTLALLVAAIYWGMTHDHRGILWLGYIGFSIEILALYFETVGSLLGTSLFFLIAGIIVMGLAAVAYQLHNRTARLEGN